MFSRIVFLIVVLACRSSGFVVAQDHETEPQTIRHVVAVTGVCAWPNLTLLDDGTIVAILHNQPSHGQQEGDIDCWASRDGITWEKRSTVTQHEPNTVRMNHAAGTAHNGDLVVLCSGWTDVKQSERPKQAPFRDAILAPWVLRSADGGRTWAKNVLFPKAQSPWSEFIPFGDIWRGRDGSLHTSCYQGEYKAPTESSKTKGWRSWHFRSDDDGITWQAVSIIGPRHNETNLFRLHRLQDNVWLAAARTTQVDIVRSDDSGVTWQPPQPVTARNEINGHLARIDDDHLLLTYGVRVKGRRGVCAKVSGDDGQTWGPAIRLLHAVGEADCGYPSSVVLPDGNIVTAWYSRESALHNGYHMGVTVWQTPRE